MSKYIAQSTKYKVFLLSIGLVVFLGTMYSALRTSFAQTFDSVKAYQDYQYSLSIYTQANSDFEAAKDFYSKNQTLSLKEDARKKLLTMLKSRDQLEVVYLTALRTKISELKGLADGDKSAIFGKIDTEVAWYKNHITSYGDGDAVETLFTKSDESKSHYSTTTIPIVYESLFDISLGEEVGIRQDHETIYNTLKLNIATGVAAGKLDVNQFNRWFTDIDSNIQILHQNEDLSKTQIQKMYDAYTTGSGSFNDSINTLSSSIKPLTQLNEFLTEVLTSIRSQQQ